MWNDVDVDLNFVELLSWLETRYLALYYLGKCPASPFTRNDLHASTLQYLSYTPKFDRVN